MVAKKFTRELFNNDPNESTADLVYELMQNIRDQDMLDLKADDGDPEFQVMSSLRLSDEAYIYRGESGELLCVFGIGHIEGDFPGRTVWMLGTKDIEKYKRELLVKEAKAVIADWLQRFGLLYNAVHESNEKSRRWLTRLGARWMDDERVGAHKDFIPFFIAREGVIKNV